MIAEGPIVAAFAHRHRRAFQVAGGRLGPSRAPRGWSGSAAGSRCRTSRRAGAGRAPRRRRGDIPNGVHVAGFARARRSGVRGSTGRRSASWAGSTSRARGCRCCSSDAHRHPATPAPACSSPDGGTPRRSAPDRRGPRASCRCSVSCPRRTRRVPPLGRHLLRAQPARGVLRRHPHRGPGGGGAHRGQRPGCLRPGARGRRRGSGGPPRGPDRAGPRPVGLLADPGRRAELSAAGGGRWPPGTTGRCWPDASSRSTRPSPARRAARRRTTRSCRRSPRGDAGASSLLRMAGDS